MAEAGTTLTDYIVDADGTTVRLNGRDDAGRDFSLRLSIDQVGSLMMTLPQILTQAVRTRYRDDSLRYVFGLGSWTLETTPDAAMLVLNLSTIDGFNGSFGLSRSIMGDLAGALADEQATGEANRTP
jgi:hypothetical protein